MRIDAQEPGDDANGVNFGVSPVPGSYRAEEEWLSQAQPLPLTPHLHVNDTLRSTEKGGCYL